MHVILYLDFLEKFILSRQNPFPSTSDYLRIKIVENPDNVIVYSPKYVNFLHDYFESTQYYTDFSMFMLRLMDNEEKGKSIKSCKISVNAEQEFISICNTLVQDFSISISEATLSSVPHSYSIASINKPNKHWLFCNIAANHSLAIERHDFNSEQEIQIIFDSMFNHRTRILQVYYFDRYCNLNKHQRFKNLYNKSTQVDVYTFGSNQGSPPVAMTQIELEGIKRQIIRNFGLPCNVHYTRSPLQIHQRRIMFNNFIIKPDHDFAFLDMANQGWTINVSYCRNNFAKYVIETTKYTAIA